MFTRITSIIVLLLVCGYALNAAVVKPSPWEHSSAEVGVLAPTVIPGTNPLTYTTSTFSREREMYGYYPRFKPNMVTFDYNNRPYIYVGKASGEVPSSNTFRIPRAEFFGDCYIQTLNDNGQWIVVDLYEISKTIAGNQTYTDFDFYTGTFSNINRVTFDSNGGIYFTAIEQPIFNSTPAAFIRRIFYGTVDNPEIWKNAAISNGTYIFETPDAFTSDFDVPSLLGTSSNQMKVIPIINANGDLTVNGAGILIGDRIQPGPLHSGIVNAAVTLGNYIHIGYRDMDNLIGTNETAQYYVRYNKLTQEFSPHVFLGSTVGIPFEGSPDDHNGPAITVDIARNIHAVLGAHGNTMKYTYSTDNGDSWTSAVDLVDDATYPSVCTTPDGTIHLVYRKSSEISSVYKYRLYYAKKEAGQNWQDVGALVEPYRTGYGIYYHKLTADRLGNLYLNYSYLAAHLSSAEEQEHQTKWPGEDPGAFSHDSSILTSQDNGASWHLATTADFVNNVTEIPYPLAITGDLDRNGIVDSADLVEFLQNWLAVE